uniref:G_PROTEIN_RECEP_F1_2 domain-containing protein n=1 Tax=Haemonchus contortus TaxID=6289 RepID=A0A7I4YJ27_HAECO
MYPDMDSILLQVIYIVVPTLSLIRNALIVYATVVSRKLRNPCNIFIALIALGDVMFMFSFFISAATYNRYNDHQIPQDICVYLYIVPIFGQCFSAMLLLNLAIDRLLSLTASWHNNLINQYAKVYITVQVLPACIFGGIVNVLAILVRDPDKNVICTMVAPLLPSIGGACVKIVTTVCILLIICYSLFGLLVRNLRMNTESMRAVYRSLVVITVSIVFGNFCAMGFAMTDDFDNPSIFHIQLTGLFMSFGTSVNFFAYY